MGAVAAGNGAMSEPDHGSSQPAQRSGVRTTLPHEELGSLNDTVLARNRMTRNFETRMRDLTGESLMPLASSRSTLI